MWPINSSSIQFNHLQSKWQRLLRPPHKYLRCHWGWYSWYQSYENGHIVGHGTSAIGVYTLTQSWRFCSTPFPRVPTWWGRSPRRSWTCVSIVCLFEVRSNCWYVRLTMWVSLWSGSGHPEDYYYYYWDGREAAPLHLGMWPLRCIRYSR